MDINRLKSQLPDAEIVGAKRGQSVVRVYTEEKGWCYAKVDDASLDAAIDAFAAAVKRAPASRNNLKVGK